MVVSEMVDLAIPGLNSPQCRYAVGGGRTAQIKDDGNFRRFGGRRHADGLADQLFAGQGMHGAPHGSRRMAFGFKPAGQRWSALKRPSN